MAKHPAGISIDAANDGYLLRRTSTDGKTRGLKLSANDVLQIAESATSLRDRLIQQIRGTRGKVPVFAIPVDRFELPKETLGENVLMTMVPVSGQSLTYSLSQKHAQVLVDAISLRLEQLSAQPRAQ